MQDEEFIEIQSALRRATHEPAGVPASLMADTMRRCEAVAVGRNAEEHLCRSGKGSDLSFDELCELTAAGLLGRIAMKKSLPEGQSIPELIRRIAALPGLRESLSGTAEDAIRCLDSGIMLRSGAEQGQSSENTRIQNEESTAHKQVHKPKGGLQR